MDFLSEPKSHSWNTLIYLHLAYATQTGIHKPFFKYLLKRECLQQSTADVNMAKLVVSGFICFQFTDITILVAIHCSDAKESLPLLKQIDNSN